MFTSLQKTLLLLCMILCSIATTSTTSQAPVQTVSTPIKAHHPRIPFAKVHHRQKKVKVHCAQRCMNVVKDAKVKECKRAYQLGKFIKKCSFSKIKGKCHLLCKRGGKFCFNKCHFSTCAGKKVKICKNHCSHGKNCQKKCSFLRSKRCMMERLPGRFVKKCKFITKKKEFKNCFKKCTKHVKVKTCSQRCRNVSVPHKFRKCLRILVRKAKTVHRCSLSSHVKVCANKCKAGKKTCFRKCHPHLCGGKRFTSCKWKCTRSPQRCLAHCSLKRQKTCLLKRIPEKYQNKCSTVLARKNVRRCFAKCHTRRLVINL